MEKLIITTASIGGVVVKAAGCLPRVSWFGSRPSLYFQCPKISVIKYRYLTICETINHVSIFGSFLVFRGVLDVSKTARYF